MLQMWSDTSLNLLSCGMLDMSEFYQIGICGERYILHASILNLLILFVF